MTVRLPYTANMQNTQNIQNIQNMHVMQTNLSMNNNHCHDMQKKCNIVTSYCYFQNAEYTVFAKKNIHDQQKNMINKTLQNIGKNAILSVYHAVFGGYHPV